MTAPIAISNSEMQTWKRCPREWLTTYYWGYLPADPSPLGAANLGTRVHLALEAKFGYGLDPLQVLDIIYGTEAANHPELATDLGKDLEMSKIMVAGLLGGPGEDGQPGQPGWLDAEGHSAEFAVIRTEDEIQVPLPGFEGQVKLRGKLDQIIQWLESGEHAFLDWKTRDQLEPPLMVRQDPQLRLYSLIQWLAAGYPPPQPGRGLPSPHDDGPPLVLGGTVCQLRKVKRSQKSRPPYYQWDAFRHTPEIMATTLIGAQQVVSEILAARAELDAAYENGGTLEQIDYIQRSRFRPVWITRDCSWRCPLAKGACMLMDDGSAWAEHFESSGAFVRGDPYARYQRGSIAALVSAAG